MSRLLRRPARPAPPPNPYAPPPRPGYGPARPPGPRWRHPWTLPARLGALSRRRWKPALLAAGGVAALALAASWGGGFRYEDLAAVAPPAAPTARRAAPEPGRRVVRRPGPARVSPARLERLIAAQRPPGVYIEVDTLANRLYLMRGDEVVREAVCSTGTGGVLEDPASGRRWVFDTPRGAHRVVSKVEHPVWNKPDWAFIEEGQPVPADPAARVDTYSLGDYALYLGDGYIIHGTLYQRLLGRSVTHGCVRLGDEDLEAVFKAAPLGTRVYIY